MPIQIMTNKLIILLGNTIKEDRIFYIIIKYIAKGSVLGKGIHFVNESTSFPPYIWTQRINLF